MWWNPISLGGVCDGLPLCLFIGCVTSLGGGGDRSSGQFASPVGVWGTGDLRAV